MIAYHTQAQFFVSCDQVNCLPDGVVSFRDAYRFFIIDQLAVIDKGRFYKFNLSLANSQNLIKATANVILLSQI